MGVLIVAVAACLHTAADQGEPTEAVVAGLDRLELRTDIDLTYEYRYRSADALIEEAEVKSGIDISRNVLSVPPIALVDWELGRRHGLAIGLAAELRRQFDGAADYSGVFMDDNFVPLGDSGNPMAIENHFITKGALYWRSDRLDLCLGRDTVDLGEGIEGSLYPSPRLPYLDAFRAKGRFGRLGMDWLVATMRAMPSWDGHDVDPNAGLNAEDFPSGDEEVYGFQNDPNPTTIVEALHRFTWDFDSLQIGIAGHVIYARRNNYFTITDFLPVIAWHQTTVMPNNLSMLIDASWTPLPGLRFSGMAGLDEVNASDVGVSDSGSPTVYAGVMSARYEGGLGTGRIAVYAEGGYTHYLWGNYDGSTDEPGDADPLGRYQYRLLVDAGDVLLPLTSPYGPGATWGLLKAGYELPGIRLRIGAELLILSKIKDANLVTTSVLGPNLAASSRLLFVEAALPISRRLGSFDLYARPAALVRDGKWWGEARLGVSYRLRHAKVLSESIRSPR